MNQPIFQNKDLMPTVKDVSLTNQPILYSPESKWNLLNNSYEDERP